MRNYTICFLALSALTACGDADNATGPEATTTPAPPVTQPDPASTYAPELKPLAAGDDLFPWVDNVNVRDAATTDGKRVARIPEGEALKFTGKQSATKDAVLLRGMVYEEPWYEVTTKDGATGWVFGGTVKRKDEKKGNPVPSDTKIFYPYFGTYDLGDWEQMPNIARSGGDATTVVQTYEQDGKEMSIERTDVGEYGYTHTYTLRDPDGKVMLTRELRYDATDDHLLSETVVNRIQSPAVQYRRSQHLPKSVYELGGQPLMVNGEWKEKTVE